MFELQRNCAAMSAKSIHIWKGTYAKRKEDEVGQIQKYWPLLKYWNSFYIIKPVAIPFNPCVPDLLKDLVFRLFCFSNYMKRCFLTFRNGEIQNTVYLKQYFYCSTELIVVWWIMQFISLKNVIILNPSTI